MTMTYLHAQLKSNPEGSIDLWVSEMEKPYRKFYEGHTGSGVVFYSKDFDDAMEKWQESFVCFPTLPEQRARIMEIADGIVRIGFGFTGKPLKGILNEGLDCDPGLFEIGCCVAVLKSTPAQEEDLWVEAFGIIYNHNAKHREMERQLRAKFNITRKTG